MLRKTLSPILFIIFGLVLIFVESSITLPVDSSGDSHNNVNLFNRILLFGIVALIIIFEVIPQSKKMTNKIHKFLYSISISVLLIVIVIFWIIQFTWK